VNDLGFFPGKQCLDMKKADEVSMSFQERERSTHRHADRLCERHRAGRLQAPFQRRYDRTVPEYRGEDLFLGLEMVVEQTLGRIELQRDIIHGRRSEPLGREYFQPGANYFGACPLRTPI